MTHYLIGHRMNWIFGLITKRNLVAFENWSIRAREAMLKKRSMKEQLHEAGKFLVSNYRFITIADVLFDMGVYNYALYKSLKRFNNCRNKVAHRLLSDLPTQSELGGCFKQGMRLWESIDKIFKEQSALSFGTIDRTSAK